MKLPGLIVPPLTPFTEDLKVDVEKYIAALSHIKTLP